MRILIANRGEIARRIIRTARTEGHHTIAVYAEPDLGAPFTTDADEAALLGPADLRQSYLSVERLLAVAKQTGATALHPGYGFLSENADFAQAVLDAGLVWIGPRPAAIATMGSKIEARRLAAEARVPIIPGFDASQDPTELRTAAERIGFPILVKAAAGGGGKGIRIADQTEDFDRALHEAVSEAERSFGDGRVLVERFITRPRHVEVQVIGDQHGTVVDLGTRECSVQRRYQKLMEEAPAPNLPPSTTTGLREAAVRLAESIGYDSAGTVEFVVDDDTGDFFFLEMNTRLQVEHPVTEAVTGLDLVALQIRVATGAALAITADDVNRRGHAIEARINAEDAANGFAPQLGHVTALEVPPGVRWDSGIEVGSTITPHYDPMLAKLIVHAPTRPAALAKLRAALDGLLTGGITTNAGFHRWLTDQTPIIDGRVTTRFLDDTELPSDYNAAGAAAIAAAVVKQTRRTSGPWSAQGPRRFTPHSPQTAVVLEDLTGDTFEISEPDTSPAIHLTDPTGAIVVNRRGQSHTLRTVSRIQRWAPTSTGGHGSAGAVTAPFPAVVAEVLCAPGDEVDGTAALIVIEAMKMLHTLTAGGAGIVGEVRVKPGDQVESKQVLITFEEPE